MGKMNPLLGRVSTAVLAAALASGVQAQTLRVTAANSSAPSALYDVTSGSNGSCGGSYLCTAGVGYDGPTGLGTPNGAGGL